MSISGKQNPEPALPQRTAENPRESHLLDFLQYAGWVLLHSLRLLPFFITPIIAAIAIDVLVARHAAWPLWLRLIVAGSVPALWILAAFKLCKQS